MQLDRVGEEIRLCVESQECVIDVKRAESGDRFQGDVAASEQVIEAANFPDCPACLSRAPLFDRCMKRWLIGEPFESGRCFWPDAAYAIATSGVQRRTRKAHI